MSKKAVKNVQQKSVDLQRTLEVVALVVECKKSKKELPEQVRRVKAERRVAYVRAVETRCFEMSNSICLRIAISEVARQRGEFPAPSVTTVRRWMQLMRPDGTLPSHLLFKTRQEGLQSGKNRLYED